VLKHILELVYVTRADLVSTIKFTVLVVVRATVALYFENNMKCT